MSDIAILTVCPPGHITRMILSRSKKSRTLGRVPGPSGESARDPGRRRDYRCGFFWHRPSLDHGAASTNVLGCTVTNDGSVCDAVAGLSQAIHSPLLSANRAARLPPPATPGAIDADITQANIDETICRRATPGQRVPLMRCSLALGALLDGEIKS